MSSWIARVKPFLTTANVFITLLIGGVVGALIYSETKGGLDEKMLSPLAMGKGVFFTAGDFTAKPTTSEGSHKMTSRLATADWHYRWQIEGKGPFNDESVFSELFRQPGIEVREVIKRGAPGSVIKTGYHTDADGGGAITWTLKGDGPWDLDLTVHEELRPTPKP